MYTIHTHTHRVLRTSSVRKDKFCKFYSSLYLVRFSVQASPCALLFIAFFFFFFFFPSLFNRSIDTSQVKKKKKNGRSTERSAATDNGKNWRKNSRRANGDFLLLKFLTIISHIRYTPSVICCSAIFRAKKTSFFVFFFFFLSRFFPVLRSPGKGDRDP